MDWWMLPGWCCIAIAALKLGNIDSWYHMLAFRFHFWGRKVNWNQASHVRASSVYFAGKSSVHICPSECSPLSRVLAKAASWSLDELLRMAVIAFARVAGVQYFRALPSPCFLARSSWRDRLALGAVRAIPPGVCSASPVQIIKGCCWSRLMTAISRSVPYCWPSSITISESSCMNPPIADHCIVRSWATVPPVASTIWHLLIIVFLSLGWISNLVCE